MLAGCVIPREGTAGLLGRHRGRLRHCLFDSVVEGVLAASWF